MISIKYIWRRWKQLIARFAAAILENTKWNVAYYKASRQSKSPKFSNFYQVSLSRADFARTLGIVTRFEHGLIDLGLITVLSLPIRGKFKRWKRVVIRENKKIYKMKTTIVGMNSRSFIFTSAHNDCFNGSPNRSGINRDTSSQFIAFMSYARWRRINRLLSSVTDVQHGKYSYPLVISPLLLDLSTVLPKVISELVHDNARPPYLPFCRSTKKIKNRTRQSRLYVPKRRLSIRRRGNEHVSENDFFVNDGVSKQANERWRRMCPQFMGC